MNALPLTLSFVSLAFAWQTPQIQKITPKPIAGLALGDDIAKVIRSFGIEPKSEFETREQYNARRASAPAIGRHVRFVVEESAPRASFTYDADAQEMALHLKGDRTLLPDAPSTIGTDEYGRALFGRSVTLVVRRALVKSGSYIGENAYGASAIINYSEYEEWGIRLDPGSPFRLDHPDHPVGDSLQSNFTFSVGLSEARSLKPFLRAVLDGVVTEGDI
jgi:hypothetical protein